MAEFYQTTTYTVKYNNQEYSFTDPHPITELINEYNSCNNMITLLQNRIQKLQSRVDELDNQIVSLCITPV